MRLYIKPTKQRSATQATLQINVAVAVIAQNCAYVGVFAHALNSI